MRAAASRRRRPAARVPQVRFEQALRRLRPENTGQTSPILNDEFAPEWARQSAAAPGRRAAISRCSKAAQSAWLRACQLTIRPIAWWRGCPDNLDTAGIGGLPPGERRRPASRVPQVRFERALRRLQPEFAGWADRDRCRRQQKNAAPHPLFRCHSSPAPDTWPPSPFVRWYIK